MFTLQALGTRKLPAFYSFGGKGLLMPVGKCQEGQLSKFSHFNTINETEHFRRYGARNCLLNYGQRKALLR